MNKIFKRSRNTVIIICIILTVMIFCCNHLPKRYYIPQTDVYIVLEHRDNTTNRIYICGNDNQCGDYIDFDVTYGRTQTLFYKKPDAFYVINERGVWVDTIVTRHFKIYNVVENPSDPTQSPSDCRFKWPRPLFSDIIDLRDSSSLNSDYVISVMNNLSDAWIGKTDSTGKYYFY